MNITKQLTPSMEAKYQDKISSAALHTHYDTSCQDGAQSPEEGVRRAKELGASAVCISDHGTAMGFDDFNAAAQKYKVKPVFGVEAYLQDPLTGVNAHLVLYAKDNIGFRQLCQTLARGEFLKDGRCILHDENLDSLRGGHIIATSACINGVFGSLILYNRKQKEKIEELRAEISEMQDAIDTAARLNIEIENAKAAIALMKSDLSAAKKAAKPTVKAKVNRIESMKKKLEKAQAAFDKYAADGKDASLKSVKVALAQLEVLVDDPDELEEALEKAATLIQQNEAQLASEMSNAQAIADSIPGMERALIIAKDNLANQKAAYEVVAKDAAKAQTKEAKILEYESNIVSQADANVHIQNRMKLMLDVFGSNFYMEMQNHGIPVEADIFNWEYRLAKKYKVPLVAANDAHISVNTEDAMLIRQIRRSCRFNKWEERQVGDDELYLKTDRELALALYQILPEEAVMEAMDNISKIVDQCNATIVKESHAPKAKVENVREEMVKLARANIAAKYGSEWGEKHEERLNYEVNIIDSMGFSDYFYITWDILNVARYIGALSYAKLDELKSIMNDMNLDELMAYLQKYGTEINLSVGLGRGSGAGSIVCYLLGITNIDPFKYDLLFERFLNPERISMPESKYRAFNVNPITQGCAA